MLLTTTKLIMLRLYNKTLGRFACFDRLLKKLLVKTFVTGRDPEERYTASSEFFDMRDIAEGDNA